MSSVNLTMIFLPTDLKADLKRIARETGQSVSDLIREGAVLVVADHDTAPPKPAVGYLSSGDPGWIEPENLDRLMAEGFGRD